MTEGKNKPLGPTASAILCQIEAISEFATNPSSSISYAELLVIHNALGRAMWIVEKRLTSWDQNMERMA